MRPRTAKFLMSVTCDAGHIAVGLARRIGDVAFSVADMALGVARATQVARELVSTAVAQVYDVLLQVRSPSTVDGEELS